ncbi:hypothetical protein HZS_4101, partial [Henneguya salminicola]
MPKIITVDFEYSLISPVKHEFTASKILACYFYYKQELLRKLTKFKVCMVGVFFLDAHSNLATFISVIKAEFDFYSEKYIEARENANGI